MRDGEIEAEDILIEKYSCYISKKINEFRVRCEYDDIFQESLIILYKSLDTYIDSKNGFFCYFNENLKNKLISLKRQLISQQRREVIADHFFEFTDNDTISTTTELLENEIFKVLTKEEKTVVILKYIKHLSFVEIAKEFGFSSSKVYSIIRRIRKKIKENM